MTVRRCTSDRREQWGWAFYDWANSVFPSVYEVSENGIGWLGPLLYALALQFTGSYRVAILSLVILLVARPALLSRVSVRRAALEAGNEMPSRDRFGLRDHRTVAPSPLR